MNYLHSGSSYYMSAVTTIAPFFPLAFKGFSAYEATKEKFPIWKKQEIEGRVIWKQLSKGSPEYNEELLKRPGSEIKEEMLSFLDQQKIRKDLIIAELNTSLITGGAIGTNFFTSGEAIIIMPIGLYKTDKEACCFIMKHEISHIKNNDVFTSPVVGSISALASAIFPLFNSISTAFDLTISSVFSLVSSTFFSRWQEGKADDFAIANSSDQELLGGRRFFSAIKKMHLEERETLWWRKLTVSPSGNFIIDIVHPSLTSRIEKIERILVEKRIFIDHEKENEKIERLKNFFIKKKQESEELKGFEG